MIFPAKRGDRNTGFTTMRRTTLLIGLGLLLSTGCYARYHGAGYYGYNSGYSSSYGSTGVVYNQPVQPQPQAQGQVVVQQPAAVAVPGEGIAGSDGTRGWRVTVQSPEQEFQRLAQMAANARCQVEASTQTELRAVCNGNVHIFVRFDQQNVYKLCAPNTDPSVCAQVWSSFGG